MVTYIVAGSAWEAARYRRISGLDRRHTRTVLWAGELAGVEAAGARVVFVRGWSTFRSEADTLRLRALAEELRAAGATIVESVVDDDAIFRLDSRRPSWAA